MKIIAEEIRDIYDLIIIGSGSAGLTAGIYAGRAQLKTLILEKAYPGGQILTTAEVVNYPGIKHTDGPDLITTMYQQSIDFGVEITTDEVIDLELTDIIKTVKGVDKTYYTLAVIIATGATPRKVGFPGEEEYTGRGVSYCSTCDGHFFKGLDLFVLGGGYAASEEAVFLTRFAKSIKMIVRRNKLSCPASMAERVLQNPKIEVLYQTEITAAGGEDFLTWASFKNNQTGEIFTYRPSEEDQKFGIFVFVGYKPETAIFRDKVNLDKEGYIITDDHMQTNVSGVYAAGDLRPKPLRQIVTAVSDGAIAAVAAEKYISHIKE